GGRELNGSTVNRSPRLAVIESDDIAVGQNLEVSGGTFSRNRAIRGIHGRDYIFVQSKLCQRTSQSVASSRRNFCIGNGRIKCTQVAIDTHFQTSYSVDGRRACRQLL